MSPRIAFASALAAAVTPLALVAPAQADDTRPEALVFQHPASDPNSGGVTALWKDGVGIGDTVDVSYAPCDDDPSSTCVWHDGVSLGATGISNFLAPDGFEIPVKMEIPTSVYAYGGETIFNGNVYASDPSKPDAVDVLHEPAPGMDWVGGFMEALTPCDYCEGLAGAWASTDVAEKDGVAYEHVATGTLDFWAPQSALSPLWPDANGNPLPAPAGSESTDEPAQAAPAQEGDHAAAVSLPAADAERGERGWLIGSASVLTLGLLGAAMLRRKRRDGDSEVTEPEKIAVP